MEIKKVFQNEIHWTIRQWNVEQQANNRIREVLGEPLSQYFATCHVGADFYSWTTPANGKWLAMTQAPTDEVGGVKRKWEVLQQEVRTKLAAHPELAERILEIPNDEYIYYRWSQEGNVELLVTGWGFRNFKRPVYKPIVNPSDNHTRAVTVAFTCKGEKVPNRAFFIVATKKHNARVTDGEGNCDLGNLDIGTTVTLIDGPTQQPFAFTVEADKGEYTFEVPAAETVEVPEEQPDQEVPVVTEIPQAETPKKRNPWLEVLMFILLLAALVAIGFLFHHGINALSSTIQQNIY